MSGNQVPVEAPAPAAIPKKGKGRKAEGEQLASKHPPVASMISDAIATLNERRGSSLHAIKRYIADTYKIDVQKLTPHLKRALKKGVESGHLTKPTGKGASGSFKLAVKSKATNKPAVEEKRKGKVVGPSKPKKRKVAQSSTKKESEAPKAGSSARVKLAKTSEPSSSAKPKGGETEKAGASPDPDGFRKLLGVDLVTETLLQHLSVRDMKALSSVSKDALTAVRKTRVFAKRVQFRICQGSIRSRVLDNSFHSWKSVRFYSLRRKGQRVGSVPAPSTITRTLNAVQSLTFDFFNINVIEHSKRRQFIDFILSVMRSSNETLEDLTVYFPCVGLEEIQSIPCPNLKRLKLVTYGYTNHQVVEAFLRNLSPLEELTVRGLSLLCLIGGLQGRMSKLKKLDISIETDLEWCINSPPETADVRTIENMMKLEDLQVILPHNCPESYAQLVEEIFQCIPTKTMKRMTILDTPGEFRACPNIGEHIRRFTNLTELSLHNLEKFDDANLQAVIKDCPKLKKLTLDELENLTAFGFTGVRRSSPTNPDGPHFASNELGVPLSNLRDLNSLTIRDCGPTTLATLLDIIRFEFLTSLDLCLDASDLHLTQSPREFLVQIIHQNPSLYEIVFNIRSSNFRFDPFTRRDYSLERQVKRRNPRIKKLVFAYTPSHGDDARR